MPCCPCLCCCSSSCSCCTPCRCPSACYACCASWLQCMQCQQQLHRAAVQQRVVLQQLLLAPGQRPPLRVGGAAQLRRRHGHEVGNEHRDQDQHSKCSRKAGGEARSLRQCSHQRGWANQPHQASAVPPDGRQTARKGRCPLLDILLRCDRGFSTPLRRCCCCLLHRPRPRRRKGSGRQAEHSGPPAPAVSCRSPAAAPGPPRSPAAAGAWAHAVEHGRGGRHELLEGSRGPSAAAVPAAAAAGGGGS